MSDENKVPNAAEQRKAHAEALKVELAGLEGRTDDVGKRRAGEVKKQLERFGDKPSSRSRETASA